MSDTDEFEPKYVPLRKLKAADWMQKMPLGMHDMIVDRHIRLRNEIGRIIGEIELSYYRGREAGREECSLLLGDVKKALVVAERGGDPCELLAEIVDKLQARSAKEE